MFASPAPASLNKRVDIHTFDSRIEIAASHQPARQARAHVWRKWLNMLLAFLITFNAGVARKKSTTWRPAVAQVNAAPMPPVRGAMAATSSRNCLVAFDANAVVETKRTALIQRACSCLLPAQDAGRRMPWRVPVYAEEVYVHEQYTV